MRKIQSLDLNLGKKTLFVYKHESGKNNADASPSTGDTTTSTITLTGTLGRPKSINLVGQRK
jgi:hypothetical protein